MTAKTIRDYVHTPGNPVLDRVAAERTLTNSGRSGHVIADGDAVRLVGERKQLLVTGVDHQSGQITVTADTGTLTTLPGVDVEVVALASHPAVPDDVLESMTLEQARTRMALIASDYGRYPQYGDTYFAGWVFGRVNDEIRFRNSPHGDVLFVAGQRVLVRTDDRSVCGVSGLNTITAWSTRWRRHGIGVSVWHHQIRLETQPGDL
ncbi:hypothetical protein BDK92_2626 [Micromonospora pisi]|uniref:Uncharacterized protein n=1 Tax=Micromonospora pisi TaxID=589240 RepID=A0A495JHS9_9ACTN|nr:hypothetical protein [Micromonospora pisi]RKR88315.1 hypothetical protein BDK92_2626 [Micromonospora pisi]